MNYNLDDNIYLQWIANIGLLLLSAIWFAIFVEQDTFDPARIALIHENTALNVDCVGIILFNFAFIVTVPSWYNEKEATASVVKSLLYSIVFVAVLFIVLGVLAAMSFLDEDLSNDNQSLFTVIDDYGGRIGKISVYLYPIIQNITSIPVFCIIIRYNLQNSGLSKYVSNFLSIIVPWLLAVPLFTGSGFTNLCDFTGIVLGSFVNFILPPYLYLLSLRMSGRKDAGIVMLSFSDKDEQYESDADQSDGGGALKKRDDIAPTKDHGDELEVAAAAGIDVRDDEVVGDEQVQLFEVHQRSYTQVRQKDDEEEEEDDDDFAKKNALRWTWDVVVA
eukprot:CAMPEP_0197043644 /NCGR_PEP_ID=MMETSP1384-20130603/19864_1 /TAXON_ID=29189 /ORGANISM="Ammonia sp." /LENGTH=332 /DNA_ID=CAMNT_0042474973 /DNA_START=25 /DNA_END=1020 /DNA_ORIENTATION=+